VDLTIREKNDKIEALSRECTSKLQALKQECDLKLENNNKDHNEKSQKLA
jgi:hypothetical protein